MGGSSADLLKGEGCCSCLWAKERIQPWNKVIPWSLSIIIPWTAFVLNLIIIKTLKKKSSVMKMLLCCKSLWKGKRFLSFFEDLMPKLIKFMCKFWERRTYCLWVKFSHWFGQRRVEEWLCSTFRLLKGQL